MKPYLAVLSARFRTLLQYRAAALAGLGTQMFWGLIRVMIFEAFYRSTRQPQPMRRDEIITYIWLGQAFFALLPWVADADVREMVRSGTVAYEMLRPVDLYSLWFFRAMAARTAPTVLRAVPMCLVAIPFLGMGTPPTWGCALAWIAGMIGAVLLASAFANLLTISLLWTTSGEGVIRIASALVYLLSGLVLPMAFFPNWIQPVVNFLPFRAIMDTPFRLYIGHIPAQDYAAVFTHQIVWIVALALLGRMLLSGATRRLTAQGG